MTSTSNRLTALAADIRKTHAIILHTTTEVAQRIIDAGHMLIEAKASVPHGQWEAWLSDHAGLSARTARRYMQVARTGLETAIVAGMGIVGAIRTVARLRPKVLHGATPLSDDPAYLAWEAEVLTMLEAAPNARAQRVMWAMMMASAEAA